MLIFVLLITNVKKYKKLGTIKSVMSYLIKVGVAVGGVFGERRGPTHHGLVQAVAVVRHAHATLVQVCLLLQKGA